MRYWLGVCVSILTFTMQPSIAKESTVQCPTLRFERQQVISLKDLGRLADEKATASGVGSIVFRFFDVEDRPVREGAHAVGLVLARMGDLAETPLGGYLWVTGSSEAVVDGPVLNEDGGVASMTLTTDQSPVGCRPVAFTFTLQPDGEFHAGGMPVGTVK